MKIDPKVLQYFELLELNGVEGTRIAREYIEACGFSLECDLDQIRIWLIENAEKGDCKAQYALAQYYLRGAFGYMDREMAYGWCVKSAQQDYGPAVFLLAGLREEELNGAPADKAEALRLMHKAIVLKYGPAARMMGLQYLTGTFVPKNVDVAREYFLKGVDMEDSASMFQLALMLRGDGSAADQALAISLLERAASMDDSSALRTLESMYEYGHSGCEVDSEKARVYGARADLVERPYSYSIDTSTFLRPFSN